MNSLLFIFLFAILNRLRGSDLRRFFISYSKISRLLVGGIVGYLIKPDYQGIIIGIILYAIGESFGWGKWLATCIDGEKRFNEKEGRTKIFNFYVWDGIHHITNLFIPEIKNHILYSKVALIIRGMYWWLPLLLYACYYNVITHIVYSVLISLLFGICFVCSISIAKIIKFRILYIMKKDNSETDHIWEKSEIIYGLFQGILIYIFIV